MIIDVSNFSASTKAERLVKTYPSSLGRQEQISYTPPSSVPLPNAKEEPKRTLFFGAPGTVPSTVSDMRLATTVNARRDMCMYAAAFRCGNAEQRT